MDNKDRYYTIFVVEDSDVYRSMLMQDLESENDGRSGARYKVYGFASGEEVMEQVAKRKPDIMIMDYLLNGNGYDSNMNGSQLLDSVRSLFPKLDVIVLSCHENARVMKELMHAGIKKYIRKESLGQHKVKQVVNELIRDKERRQSAVKYALATAALLLLGAFLTFILW